MLSTRLLLKPGFHMHITSQTAMARTKTLSLFAIVFTILFAICVIALRNLISWFTDVDLVNALRIVVLHHHFGVSTQPIVTT